MLADHPNMSPHSHFFTHTLDAESEPGPAPTPHP